CLSPSLHDALPILLEKLAFLREHLNPAVLAIGDVNGPVLRNPDGMHDAELLRTGIREALWRHDLAVVVIRRFVAKGAPHPLERPAIRIEDNDPVVAVTVSHEYFVGLWIHPLICRPVHIPGVRVAF